MKIGVLCEEYSYCFYKKYMSKLILYLEKCYGDDLGRGKSVVSKRRFKRMIKVRFRRYINKIGDEN